MSLNLTALSKKCLTKAMLELQSVFGSHSNVTDSTVSVTITLPYGKKATYAVPADAYCVMSRLVVYFGAISKDNKYASRLTIYKSRTSSTHNPYYDLIVYMIQRYLDIFPENRM
jgi:hypothetical protein